MIKFSSEIIDEALGRESVVSDNLWDLDFDEVAAELTKGQILKWPSDQHLNNAGLLE